MKIIDCFTFFNELDLLEFRLKLLDPYVDHFIIAESNLTHSGLPKPYHYRANEKRYEQWWHKITYLPIVQTTEGLEFNPQEEKYNPTSASWKLENEQRDALSAAAKLANDEDLVITGDLDEIPDPTLLKQLNLTQSPVALSQLFHYYFMNCQNTGLERWWNGSIVSTGKQFKALSPQQLRDNRNNYPVIKKGGWHFSYLGGLEKIKYKLQSFAHTEFNKEEYLQDEHILQSLEQGKDILKRPGVAFKFVSLYYYPPFLRRLMQQYPAFIHLKRKDTLLDKFYYSTLRILSAIS